MEIEEGEGGWKAGKGRKEGSGMTKKKWYFYIKSLVDL